MSISNMENAVECRRQVLTEDEVERSRLAKLHCM
jgi:hypothetical protein